MPSAMFKRFKNELKSYGKEAFNRRSTLIGRPGFDEIFYTPFEHVSPDARLVLVGITPGKTQIESSYEEARKLLQINELEENILNKTKRIGAFSGDQMRSESLFD